MIIKNNTTIYHSFSQEELEIADFVEQIYGSHYAIRYSKHIPSICARDKKVAIKCHDLYYISAKTHANFKREIREAHEVAREENIKMIQFFEDEWRDKKSICQSMIRHRLNISTNNIYARKCVVKKVETKERKKFFNRTHISGDVPTGLAYGLYYQDKLVACLSLRKPYTRKHIGAMEIARYACELNTSVIGGFQKILKTSLKVLQEKGFKRLLTYADARFGHGNVYIKSGFKQLKMTTPGYFYTQIDAENKVRTFRFKHKKINRPEYIERWGNTEKLQNHNQNYWEVYDAGHYVYELEIPEIEK